MKMTILKGLTTAGVALALGGWFAWAQSSSEHQHGTNTSTDTTDEGGTGMVGHPGMMTGQGHGMMEGMNMPEGMIERCRMMVQTAISRDDPAVLLGAKKKLDLTDDQVTKLEAVAARAREDARAVLTEPQRTELEKLPAGHESMVAMMTRMHEHMHGAAQGAGKTTGMSKCPMMQMMIGQSTAATGEHSEHHAE